MQSCTLMLQPLDRGFMSLRHRTLIRIPLAALKVEKVGRSSLRVSFAKRKYRLDGLSDRDALLDEIVSAIAICAGR